MYVGIWILQILMLQNMNFRYKKRLFVIVIWKDPNRAPQNLQKYILQQKYVAAGRNLPYMFVCGLVEAYRHCSLGFEKKSFSGDSDLIIKSGIADSMPGSYDIL